MRLVNVPRPPKVPKPLLRRTKLPRARTRIKPIGKNGARKMRDKAAALRRYFRLKLDGHAKVEGQWQAPCQICGYTVRERHADPAHKERAWKGDDRPTNILAAHRGCHDWMDADKARERVALADAASCATGGVVAWPEAMKENLMATIRAYYTTIRSVIMPSKV